MVTEEGSGKIPHVYTFWANFEKNTEMKTKIDETSLFPGWSLTTLTFYLLKA